MLPRVLSSLLLTAALAGSSETLPADEPADSFSPRVPVRFEPNLGQSDPEIRFVARAAGYSVGFLADGSARYFFDAGNREQQYTLRVEFLGRRDGVMLSPDDLLPSVTNTYTGQDPGGWVAGIPNYGRLRARSIYPGIDLIWKARGGDLEQVFLVEPGADPDRIRVHFPEATSITLDDDGALLLGATHGQLRVHPPFAFQNAGGRRDKVEIAYCVDGNVVSFRTGSYDRARRLVIDPTLNVSTYIGGVGYDRAYAVAVDASGAIYVAGETSSVKFSSVAPVGQPVRTSRDLFVSKLAANGTSLAYTTILGSGVNDSARAVAVGPGGSVYVAGVSGGSNFPTTSAAYQKTSTGSEDAVVAKLDSAGKLSWATYIGDVSADVATGLAVDAAGDAYVTGSTASLQFPTTAAAPQRQHGGGSNDAFLLKLSSSGSTLVYSTLLGGSGIDVARGVAVTSAGQACIAGVSQSANLPVKSAFQSSHKGNGDAMVACLSAAGDSWTYVTFLGGRGVDEANAIALDASGNAWVVGTTFSDDFPTTYGAYQTTRRNDYEAFLVKLSAAGSTVLMSSYLGGKGSDTATSVALDASGAAWVAGFTNSNDFPVVQAWQPALRGGIDGFAAQFSVDGRSLLASSYLGGSVEDRILSLAASTSKMVVAGVTSSVNFPVTSGTVQTKAPALSNGFVAWWVPDAAPPPPPPPPPPSASSKVGIFVNGNWSLDTGDFVWSGAPTDRTGYYGTVGDIPVVGDFNGNGKDEVGVFRHGTFLLDYDGDIHWDAPPTGDVVMALGAAGNIPIVGDWNGDGKVELGVFNNGVFMLDYNGNFTWDGTSGGDKVFSFGQAGDVPILGDWTGDHITKVGLFRNGTFQFDMNGNGTWDGAAGGDRQMVLGAAGYTPVVGDWNGDGRIKAGVVYAGTWSLDYNGNGAWEGPAGGDRILILGAAGESPVVGDWNGDGKTEVGTYIAGVWKLDYNANGAWDGAGGGDKQVTLGSADTLPVVGKW